MQQSHHPPNDHTEERNIDPYNALDKVIRLDKKHTNFDFYDPHRKVHYPIPPFDAPNNQHLLKGLWRHVNNYYFKRIQQCELERLDYLESLMLPANQCDVRFSGSMEFWYTIERLFSEGYLKRYKRSQVENMDCKNWLEEMYLLWEKTNIKDKHKKKIENEFDRIRNCFIHLGNFDKVEDTKKKLDKLRIEQNELEALLPSQEDDDQISLQIREQQANLQNECSRNSELLQQLRARVRRQLDTEDVSIIKYYDEEQMDNEDQLTGQETKFSRVKRKIQKMETLEVVKKYLEYCIRNLEQKQVAESIGKITNLQKGKGRETSYEIEFETGMNIRKIMLNEGALNELNQLREYSLYKFYNTSLKTPYSFICQNYYGFRWIYDNRNKPCALRDKNINEQMKRGKTDFPQSKASRQFEKFDICHHCKLIYPETYLLQCQYNSSKNGAPITPSSYYDPYVSQIIKLQQPKLSNRFIGKRRNSYLAYTKKNQEYICERKFCKYCMRQNYQDTLDKNGLCPFCQGNCFCTRCARNDMIVRLKSMFLLLGGDVNRLEDSSEMEKVIKGDPETPPQIPRNNVRSKSKPSKKPVGGTPARLNEKMRNIRYQLEDLRILCDLVKRRQKQKQKLVEIRCQLFSKKVASLGKGLDFKAMNDSSINTLIEEEEAREQKKLKLKKKLQRMI